MAFPGIVPVVINRRSIQVALFLDESTGMWQGVVDGTRFPGVDG
jgi:hypothetical protein